MGGLAQEHDALTAEGIGLVAISSDSAEDSRALAERLAIRFPLLCDPQAGTAARWGVAMADQPIAIPAVFVVRRDGTIAWRHLGETMSDRPPTDVVRAEAGRAGRGPAAGTAVPR